MGDKKKITAVVWHTYSNIMKQAKAGLEEILEIKIYSARFLDEGKESVEELLKDIEESDLVFFYRSTSENIWNELELSVKNIKKTIICAAKDPISWSLSTVDYKIVANCCDYIYYGGVENFNLMLRYISNEVLGLDLKYEEPNKLPWEGIYHPKYEGYFQSIEEFSKWYEFKEAPTVGMLASRGNWVNENIEAENMLIALLEEKGYNVIPVFCYSLKDNALGTKGPADVIKEFFFKEDGSSRIDGLVKLVSFFIASKAGGSDHIKEDVASSGVNLLKELNVPVFQPIISFYTTVEEWEESIQGIDKDISWTVAMPEFEGVIEPIIVAAAKREGEIEVRKAIEDRCSHLVGRIDKWIKMAKKPLSQRKVAFILHNNPCASVEATVGGGANLDTLESVARVLATMKQAGYNVDVPENGKALIDNIMDRKAISEFRWTATDEIVKKGGALKLLPVEEYNEWFSKWSPKVKEKIINAWGNPPGEEKDGVPAAMVYQDKIIVTGVEYGNAVVCAQPKRGCAGARCDGQVCKILHDPDIPPTHQYLATYRYLEHDFGADVLVHVGTHGNMEFLPGKAVGLSSDCYPDIALGTIPHLYIYNSDNPPEGTIAKRRGHAVLVDHMQTVLTQGELYDELAQLEMYLDEHGKAKVSDPLRAHVLEHIIIEQIEKANLEKQISVKDHESFDKLVEKCHEVLSLIRNTQIQDGQHIFGDIPKGDRRVEFINSILRFDGGDEVSLRREVAKLMGLELRELIENQGETSKVYEKSNGALLEEIDKISKKFIAKLLQGSEIDETYAKEVLAEKLVSNETLVQINKLLGYILDLNKRIEDSKEIEALLSGFNGEYIPAGPSGLITRGRADVLPTGRNFYSIDPYKVPTKAAYKVGQKLAQKVIQKHIDEEGKYPENIAIHWMCNDIMWADGEGLAQMFYLMGVRPKWMSNGRVSSFEIISLEELGRPRIDITVRASGLIRDNFPNSMDLLDEAIQAVAMLDEDIKDNYVRKHTLERVGDEASAEEWREATLRIFSSKPGTYGSGVNLAVYASAWKEEKDLAEVFVYWNGYGYGKGVYGKEAYKQLQSSLKSVDITYNKVATDEYDLFGCCNYFGVHGGMTAAAKVASGKDIKTYYGDTRDPEFAEVRTLADEIRRVVRTKLLNPKWIEGQKKHGYKGASEISKRVGRVYGWEATTGEVDDWIFDDITKTFISDEENRKFFEEANPWALEEMARRLLEANQRGLWKADEQVLEDLREYYIEMEGWIEERMGDIEGEFQGGAIDIFTAEEVENWKSKMEGMFR